MTTTSNPDTRPAAAARGEPGFALLIAAPFYRNEQLVEPFTRSLLACAKEIRELNARVVLINDSPDYPALGKALDSAAKTIGDAFSITVKHNPANMGWLKTCNAVMREADFAGADLLLFNSDTIVFPGAIREMARVARLDPMTGFVNPRSNNATLATLPFNAAPAQNLADCHEQYRIASRTLPDVTYVPTAVGFAVLVRNVILSEFGYFDEAYGGGYNEENDLVMRASRCGYRAVLANHAFVWHQGEASLGATETSSKQAVELANREILLRRYPEYQRLVEAWFDGVEHTAETLVSALLPATNGKLNVALDFSSFGNYHSGTHKAGLQLLQHAAPLQQRFNLSVLIEKDAYEFHGLANMGVPRAEPHGPEKFAAILRMGQPFDWDGVRRLTQKGAAIGVFMLDTIAMDCSHLYNPAVFDIWQHTIDNCDFIVYNSEFTARQFENRFANVRRRPSVVSLHSVNAQDYASAANEQTDEISDTIRNLADGYILVIGNQYPHKSVGDAANRIAMAYPDRSVVALGITKNRSELPDVPPGESAPLGPQNSELSDLSNLRGFRVGELTDAEMSTLQRKASVIVMPSYYEGFGMPILSALAFERPVIARRLPPLQEINQRLGHDPNLRFFDRTSGLVDMLKDPPVWKPHPENTRLAHDGERAVGDIADIMDRAITHASYDRIAERFRMIRTIFGASSNLTLAPAINHANNAESAAYRLGRAIERIFRPVLQVPAFYKVFQVAYRVARLGRGTSER